MGAERRSMVMPEEERRNTAYHESGHAIVAVLLPKTDPVHKVTIIPRGRALGVTMQLPTEDRYSMDRDQLLTMIAVLFGGRIAEELFMNQMTTGASNDFERATELARRMVTQWGMSDELGPMVYGENEGEVFLGRSITTHKNVSEATMQKVDAEIRRIIDQQYARRAQAAGRQPRQGRGDGQGAARVGDHRRRPDQRHHGRQAAAAAQAYAGARPAVVGRKTARPDARRRRNRRSATRCRKGVRSCTAFCVSRDDARRPPVVRYSAISARSSRPARHGHRQRHARFLLRRRRFLDRKRALAHARADRGGRRGHHRHRRRIDAARARARSRRRGAARSCPWSKRWPATAAGLRRHPKPKSCARRSPPAPR